MAIEINEFLHYKPVFGKSKLECIQELYEQKASRCKQENIKLMIIEVSNEPHLTQLIKQKHWETVKKLIDSVINDLYNKSAQT